MQRLRQFAGTVDTLVIVEEVEPLVENELKAAGMNTVSTYIPWLVHEEEEGVFDFTGQSDERNNLKHFIELVFVFDC